MIRHETNNFVIPAKAGIQYYQGFPGFRVKPGMTNNRVLHIPLAMIAAVLLFWIMFFSAAAASAQTPEIYLQLGYKTGNNVSASALAFSSDGTLLAANSGDNSIRIWETGTGREVQTLVGHGGSIKDLVFLPDNRRIVSGGTDKTVRLWDINSGKQVHVFMGHQKDVECLAVSQDGYQLASSDDGAVKIWDINTGALLATIAVPVESSVFQGYVSPIRALAFLPDNAKIIFSNLRGEVFVAGVRERRIISTLSNSKLNSYTSLKILGFTRDGKVSFGGASTLLFVDPDTLEVINKRLKADVWVEYMAPDGSLIAGRSISDSKMHVFDANLQERFSFPLDDSLINKAYSLAGNQLAVSTMGDQLKLYALQTGKELQNMGAKAFTPRNGTFSVDGAYISLDAQVTVKNASATRTNTWTNVWNLKTAARERVFNRTERTDNILKMFASANQAERENASKISTADQYYDAPKDSFSDYDELNKCFYYVEMADFYGGPWVNIYRIEAKDKYDLEPRSVQHRSKWKILKQFKAHDQKVTATAISYKHGYVATGSIDKTINLFRYPSAELLHTFKGHLGEIIQVTFSPDGTKLLSESADQTTRLWDIATGRELVRFINFSDGEWIATTPEGYYNASSNGDRYLNVRVGSNVYGIENYRESFFRPDLVKLATSGGSLEGYRTLADVKQPPKVSIVQTPASSATEDFELTLRLEEQRGGIGDVKLFLNGSAVILDNGRGVKVVQKDEKGATYRSYALRLSPGSNNIRAVAFNADNSMQSNEATHQVTASFTSNRKPTLHALVIGIQEFRNPKLQLKYSVADAKLFADTLRAGAAGLFDQIKITSLTARNDTTRDVIISALQRFTAIKPDDLFILYIASHGTVDEGEYFLITSNVGALSTQRLKSDALSQIQLKELVANIPSTKKLIVIDTCNAGQLGQAMQSALLTRGMSEDTAMKVLSRAVGSTILSASTSVQEALEGYQGHGLFTWAVTQGMKGKADKGKSGFVRTTDLAAYVEDEVPDLAEKIFKRAQFPTVSISGQGFPVGRAR